MDGLIEIDICGTIFKTKRATLKAINGSYLSKLDDSKQKYFFDKDPFLFRHILNAHREGIIHVPRDVCPLLFKKEILFWNLPLTLVAPCCWKYLYETEADVEAFKILYQENADNHSHNKVDPANNEIKSALFTDEGTITKKSRNSKAYKGNANSPTISSRLWLFLNEPGSSKAAKIWCFFYIFMVLLSVAIYIIWLDPSVRVTRYLAKNEEIDVLANETVYNFLVYVYNEKLVMLAGTDPHPVLLCIDIFCLIFFVLETIIHFIVCPNKCKYFLNVYNLLKIFLCITMITSTYFEFRKDIFDVDNYRIGEMYHAFKSFNALRLILIFRLHKIYDGLRIVLLSLRHSVKELLLLLFSFLIAVIVYGCLIFSSEIESDMFPSTQIAMWWSLITMTTIGYGDFYPTRPWGYVIGTICAINGIIVLALPIAAIASVFNNLYSRNDDYRKHLSEVQKQIDENNASVKEHTKNMSEKEHMKCVDTETVDY